MDLFSASGSSRGAMEAVSQVRHCSDSWPLIHDDEPAFGEFVRPLKLLFRGLVDVQLGYKEVDAVGSRGYYFFDLTCFHTRF